MLAMDPIGVPFKGGRHAMLLTAKARPHPTKCDFGSCDFNGSEQQSAFTYPVPLTVQ